jgi:tRNA (guanine37-N1)-methyltransferase
MAQHTKASIRFDAIGSKEKTVAIIEVPVNLVGHEEEIALQLMNDNRRVKSVLQKLGEREGVERLRKYRLLAGDSDTEVTHREHGYVLKVDPQKVYFSERESTERQRIADQVKEGETVLVMFSGVAPYAIAIAKKKNVKKIVAVEINRAGTDYARTNITLNKLNDKILAIEGDVRTACEPWYEEFDRVIMPLPKSSEDFLDIAVKCLKAVGGYIHFYSWGREPAVFEDAELAVKERMAEFEKNYEIVGRRIVLPYGPHTSKVCLDLKVG